MTNSSDRLDDLLAGVLARRESSKQLRRLTIVPIGSVDFSSNGYLSLSSHPATQHEYLAQIQSLVARNIDGKECIPLLGSGGSRLLDGNSAQAESLERIIADFHGAAEGLLFNSGMDANVGLFSCVPQPGDAIVYDELIHASVHDGMRLSRAHRRVPFAHNCIGAGAPTCEERTEEVEQQTNAIRSLEATLRKLQEGADGRPIRDGLKNVFIAVEGVYSMDGDLAPLMEIVECVERCLPRRNGYIIVDEAHSTGIFGRSGRGLVCQLGLEDRVWARVHGFGKAMGCSGGIVLCSPTTRSYLINYARTLIYTTFMPFTSLKSIEIMYGFLRSGQAEILVGQLKRLIHLAHTTLLSICLRHRLPPRILHVNPSNPRSPIIPLLTSYPRDLAQHCQESGYMVRPIVAPTVPKGRERVRICLHAGNTVEEVEGLAKAVEAWVLKLANETERETSDDTWQESEAKVKVRKARL